jgi:hypothetical protein
LPEGTSSTSASGNLARSSAASLAALGS